MRADLHGWYIVGSLLAAFSAVAGILLESPFLYGIVPGIIGGGGALVATLRFIRRKIDLLGFVATSCGFVFYQAFQANPVMLPEFTASLQAVPVVDQVVGIALGNLTTALLIIAAHIVGWMFRRPLARFVPPAGLATRVQVDRLVLPGFLIVFLVVALPHVLFGQVIIGALKSILYQRAAWGGAPELAGFDTGGGALGASLLNMTFWSTSLFFLWVYLFGSRMRLSMVLVAPLVLLWTAGVALQGSRTYLVILGFGLVVYVLGSPKRGAGAYLYAIVGVPIAFLLLQISTLFRNEGLQSFDFGQLTARIFEIRGNEGCTSQMDGLEFFRTEFVAKDAAPNPMLGLVRGMVERPIEGLLMPVPRSLFPWKPIDETAREFTLFYQNVRLGVPSQETFLGASPGLMGRELIRYGIFGPFTVLFWLGLILAWADRLYQAAAGSDFNRMFATILMAFAVAQMRDWVPMWFLPFLPAMAVFGYVAARATRSRPLGARTRTLPGWIPGPI